jgi:alkanesulfonate monooxygenase SsuD/methylene tetrahydromethanopterin reductase-like flavin-dependent oxidoreductase (luciferase family)
VTEINIAYDMRAPDFGTPAVDLYRAALEQCAWADEAGFASVVLPEHHASSDGYLPSPIVLGAAIAGVTRRLLIRINLLLLPLYHPVKAAEDLAVLDLVSGGRLRLTVGAGYRPEEYEQFGLSITRRPSLMEAGIEVLKQAWTGEPFEHDGRTLRVLPRPAQQPRPEIALGGASPASARRAARMADDYQPIAPRLYEIYLEELAELGKPVPEPAPERGQMGPLFLFVSDDPDRDWARIGPHALHESNDYGRWSSGLRGAVFTEARDVDELRQRGEYLVLTPDECVELARGRQSLTLKPLMGGLDPELGWACLHLFADQVLPRLHRPE